MAQRKITTTRSRKTHTTQSERMVAVAARNGDSVAASSSAENNPSPSFEQIQRRAYELFVARGATHGYDLADWFSAEQELIATSAAAD
jgi:hypothetical protein